MKQVQAMEFEGKTLEEATRKAALVFNTDEANLEVNVLENTRRIFNIMGGAKVRISATVKVDDQLGRKAREVLETIVHYIDEDAAVELREAGDEIVLNIISEHSGLLIGKRGDTLTALQYVLTKIVLPYGTESTKKIVVDTQGYRDKRKESLIDLAARTRSKALKTNRPVSLNISNSYERWIIHNYFVEDNSVTTKSIGEGADRKLVIYPGAIPQNGDAAIDTMDATPAD